MSSQPHERSPAAAPDARARAAAALSGLVVAVVVAAVYAPALDADFVNLDDPRVILENPLVEALDAEHLWRMATSVRSNWHPLTWLSHAIDLQLFGHDARGHHAVSVALHAANTAWLLWLFLALAHDSRSARAHPRACLMAGAGAALAFGLHPLRVESVAWATERKDVLFLFFTLPCLLAWLRYGRARALGEAGRAAYATSLMLFACALMSKPMAVSVPVLLLILDFEPLRRLERRRDWRPRIVEKLPFFAGSALLGVVTIGGQNATGALLPIEELGIAERLLNAVQNLSFYLEKTLWPAALSPRYPLDLHARAGTADALAAAAVSVLLSIVCLVAWRRRGSRALLAAWLFYLVALAPVIGLLHFGRVVAADRFGYLPLVGFHLLAGGAALSLYARGRWPAIGPVLAVAAAVLIAALTLTTRTQIAVWHDALALWGRVVEVFPGRLPDVHELRGRLYRERGELEAAAAEYRAALDITPKSPTREALGVVYHDLGRYEEAEAELARASPTASSWRWLGIVRLARGDHAGARAALARALALDPADASAHATLGDLERREGHFAAAGRAYQAAVQAAPGRADLLASLGSFRLERGQRDAAAAIFGRALALDSGNFGARLGLARLAAARGEPRAAAAELRRALRANPGHVHSETLQRWLERLEPGQSQ